MLLWNPPLHRLSLIALLCCLAVGLAACGGGGAAPDTDDDVEAAGPPSSLHQAAYEGGSTYAYGHNSVPNVRIVGAPEDTDYTRWAMVHDGVRYRLYFMKQGELTLYQFAFNGSAYEFGFDSVAVLEVTGMPPEVDPSSFKMLHDGLDYRLFMRGSEDTSLLYQAAFNPATVRYEYGFRSIDAIDTEGLPADADLTRWAMLFDGAVYRQYVGRTGSTHELYQCGFDGRAYSFGYRSIGEITVVGMPESSITSSFSMLHDGADYRFYHLGQ